VPHHRDGAHTVALPDDGRLTSDDHRGGGRAPSSRYTIPVITLLANPNNPTGALVDHDVVRALHDAVRGLLVVDEAYVEFAPGATVRPLLDELPRLVVSRTFSKAFRLAGLRLGYLLGPASLVEDLLRVRLPYHLDAITQLAGLIALEQEDAFLDHRQRTVDERDRVAVGARRAPGVAVLPSAANFLLLDTDRTDVFDRLLDHGVLVRDLSSAVGRPGTWRVTIGTPGENDRFLTALADVLVDDATWTDRTTGQE
jgi:histidinol-phosphate aminotransferase